MIKFRLTGTGPGDFVREWLAAEAAYGRVGVHFLVTVCRAADAGEYVIDGWCYYFARPAREVVTELTDRLRSRGCVLQLHLSGE